MGVSVSWDFVDNLMMGLFERCGQLWDPTRAVEVLKVGTVTTSVWKSLGEEGKFQGPSESWSHERGAA